MKHTDVDDFAQNAPNRSAKTGGRGIRLCAY